MFTFLDRHYARTGGGDLGALLGDLQINKQDGLPFDRAAWDDWLAAIEQVLSEQDRARFPASAQR